MKLLPFLLWMGVFKIPSTIGSSWLSNHDYWQLCHVLNTKKSQEVIGDWTKNGQIKSMMRGFLSSILHCQLPLDGANRFVPFNVINAANTAFFTCSKDGALWPLMCKVGSHFCNGICLLSEGMPFPILWHGVEELQRWRRKIFFYAKKDKNYSKVQYSMVSTEIGHHVHFTNTTSN